MRPSVVAESVQLPLAWSGGAVEVPDPVLARAAASGVAALTDAELLALLAGVPVDAAERLMARHGGFAAASWRPPGPGRSRLEADRVGLALGAVREAARRIAETPLQRRCVISSWTALLAYCRTVLAGAPREQFRVLFLDKKNQLIADEVLGQGTVDHAPVYPREVVRRALELSASALILVHNHPSGDPTPSSADVDMTRKVVEAARALGIAVHDHLVVGDGVASLKALGLM